MFCEKCGAPISASSSFCPKCGNQIQVHQESISIKQSFVKANKSKLIAGVLISAVVIIVAVFWFSSRPSHKWVEYNAENTGTDYYDISSIQKKGNKAKVWDLFNDNLSRSELIYIEFDCNGKQDRLLKHIKYGRPWALGEAYSSIDYETAEYEKISVFKNIPSNTLFEKLWNKVCGQ